MDEIQTRVTCNNCGDDDSWVKNEDETLHCLNCSNNQF